MSRPGIRFTTIAVTSIVVAYFLGLGSLMAQHPPGLAPELDPATPYQGYINLDREVDTASDVPSMYTQTGDSVPFGGISGIDHLQGSRYLAISDDRALQGPARVYELEIAAGEDFVAKHTDARITRTIGLTDTHGIPYDRGSVDPESIRVLPDGTFLWTSEGNTRKAIEAEIIHSSPDGRELRRFSPPPYHRDFATRRVVKNNRAYEALAVSRDGQRAVVVTEFPLSQDTEAQQIPAGSSGLSRVTVYDVPTGQPLSEFVYPLSMELQNTGHPGVSEIIAVNDDATELIFLERTYGFVAGNRASLFRVSLDAIAQNTATNVLGKDRLDSKEKPLRKRPIFEFPYLPTHPDNVESLAWCEGRRDVLFVGSDNNFSSLQRSLLHAVSWR
ncbi:esterase-like activity of phytase family protein [Corynebacterium sp. H78]|uniref:esterase-like activity of phytase family protein n=1 Tax=Corynebacterium sp. H78 TaxID=3133417 RepID=UPI0030B46467